MARLDFITKGNQNFQRKSKVYFCGHPVDYGYTFKKIAMDILEMPNCVIWYNAEPEADWDEDIYFSNLSSMQLFVIPVTQPFLHEKNRAFSKELPFAIKHHIPILPIIEDPQLETVFEKKCGYLQPLKITVKGSTALSYQERLHRYLNQVLIGDELSKKIEDAFDAKIFLAYRKVDRQFAHQFMKAVHECPRFRNVAIWYDEFLSVGENFPEQIDAAIRDSDVFAMVVTPNIIVQGAYNYVREKEYPTAMKLKREIIPIEFLKTDPVELKKEYKGIPNCIHIRNIHNALESTLADIPLTQGINDPERQFLLGLAYLGGIGLEKNPEYALQHISTAGEAYLPEAIERLVTMYYYGEAVERNISMAINWQLRLIRYYQNLYEKTGARESGIRAVHEQHKLYEYQIEAGQESEAFETCNSMRKFTRGLRRKFPRDYSVIECLIISLSDISDFLERHQDTNKSRKIQRRLLWLNRLLAWETKLPDADEDLLINYQRLGSISEEKGEIASALKYYQKSLSISDRLKKDDSSDFVYHRWLNDLYRVGHCFLQLRHVDKAELYLKKCYDGYASFQRSGLDFWRACYALSGVFCQKDLNCAELYCDESIRAVKEERDIEGRRCLADSYVRKGDILRAKKKETAKDYYQLALENIQRIYEETAASEDSERLSVAYGMLGDYFLIANDTEKAKKCYQKSIDTLADLAQDDRTWRSEITLAEGFQRIGFVFNREGNIDQTKAAFTNSIAILNRAKKQFSEPSISLLLGFAKMALKGLNRAE